MMLNISAKQAWGVIAALALHLGNAVPTRLDPVSMGFHGIRKGSRYLTALNTRSAASPVVDVDSALRP